jgi:hypothetical protein
LKRQDGLIKLGFRQPAFDDKQAGRRRWILLGKKRVGAQDYERRSCGTEHDH